MATPVIPPRAAAAAMKTRILDAAQRRFEYYGLSKTTMDEIARDVGLGKASLYYYFPAKELLFRAVLEREHRRLLDDVGAAIASPESAAAKLALFADVRFTYFIRFVNLHTLDLRGSATMQPLVREAFEEFAAADLRVLRRIIAEGKASGEFRIESSARVAAALLHIMRGLRMRFTRSLDAPPTPGRPVDARRWDELRAEFALVIQLILHGMCRNGTKPERRARTARHAPITHQHERP